MLLAIPLVLFGLIKKSVNFVRGVVIPRYLSYINSLKIYYL